MKSIIEVSDFIVTEINHYAGFECGDITMYTNFDVIGIDSLDMLDIVIAAEDQFNVEICDNDLNHIHTPHDLIEFVEERIG